MLGRNFFTAIYVSKLTYLLFLATTKGVYILLWLVLLAATICLSFDEQFSFLLYKIAGIIFTSWIVFVCAWSFFASHRGWEWRKGFLFTIEKE